MGLLRKIFWIGLFAVLTFCFVVIFEHGVDDFPDKFPEHAKAEYKSLQEFFKPMEVKENDGQVIR